MLKSFLFGEWAPDLNRNQIATLSGLANAYPVTNGYGPVPSFSMITPSLPEAWQGGAAFVASDGTASLLSGTATDLYRYSTGAWSSVLDSLSAARWYFDQFGDNVIAANGGDLISYDLAGGTAATIDDAPTAADVATVRDFVVILEPDGDQLRVQWSGFNDSEDWNLSGLNQAGDQPLLSGGKGVKIVGGENGIVLQKGAIKRMTYVGAPVVFQFDEISGEVGCMARGSVARVGQFIFFLSERGFHVCDRNSVEPIGAEKVDNEFFATYSREDIDNISAAVDPRRPIVMWAMPGNPGRIWAYNWQLKRWTTIELSLAGIFTGFTANVSIDGLDALYPGGIDDVPGSLDDPVFAGGNPLLLVANSASEIGSLAGPNMEARFVLPHVEPMQGQRTRVRSVRPISDALNVVVVLNARARAGDAENLRTASSARANGEMPVRANGRYLETRVTVAAGESWSFMQGVEMFCEAAGVR